MATYTLIEINGDFSQDLIDNGQELAEILRAIVSNPSNAQVLREEGLDRAIRFVRQSMHQEPTKREQS